MGRLWLPAIQMMTPGECLKERFGFEAFREGQQSVIDAILAGRDVVTIMPTGGGKSLCYQLPAMLLDGVTIVVSPLIALMKDQVDSLTALKIPATFINSSLTPNEQAHRLRSLRSGETRLVYVSPERFRNQLFLSGMTGLLVSLFVVDEAHCVSEWGHDFRPDYLRLKKAAETMGRPPIAAFTATATPAVRTDISEQLGLRDPQILVAGFDRRNLFLEVVHCSGDDEKFGTIAEVLKSSPGAGLIYAATRKNVDKIAEMLTASGITCAAYHAGMEDSARHRVQDDFMNGRVRVVAATNAFGMGIDKADIRFVIHFDFPGSIEAYYQEIGRAGRDGKPARCALLFNFVDRRTQEFFIEGNYPPRPVIEDVYEYLCSLGTDEVEVTIREIAEDLDSTRNQLAVASALNILDKHHVIERGNSRENLATVKLSVERATADSATSQESRPVAEESLAGRLLEVLLSDAAAGAADTLRISLRDYGARLSASDEQIRRALGVLHHHGSIIYRPAFRGRGTKILQRVPCRKLPVDYRAIEERAQREMDQLERVVRYGYHEGCSRAFILNYFGEQTRLENCGACLSCQRVAEASRQPDDEQTIAVKKVLSCVYRMRGRFGKGRVAQVLKGSRAQALSDFGLTSLSTYGLLADWSIDEITELIQRLIKAGCIASEGIDYPVVTLSAFGEKVMRGTATLSLPPVRSKKPVRPGAAPPAGRDRPFEQELDQSYDAALFEKLRALRARLSKRDEVPAYVVFNDRVLESFATVKPASKAAMLAISGVGEKKFEKYGKLFLSEIANHPECDGKKNRAGVSRSSPTTSQN